MPVSLDSREKFLSASVEYERAFASLAGCLIYTF